MSDNITWLAVKDHAQKEIERCRNILETAEPSVVEKIQARISVWREVIQLPSTLAPPPPDELPSGY